MKTRLICLFILLAFVLAIPSVSKAAKSDKELREAIFKKRALYFEKGREIDGAAYSKTLRNLYDSSEDFNIHDAIVTVGNTFIFKPTLYAESSGPEYANDALMAPAFDIEIDGRTDIEDINAFLSSLPLEGRLSAFIKENYIKKDTYINKYGLDFYLTSVMAAMIKYPEFTTMIASSIKALKKYPDIRVLPFLEKFMNEYNPPAELYEELLGLRKFIIEKKLYPEIHGRPHDCDLLYDTATIIARSTDRNEVEWALKELGRMDCKESIALLFHIKNLAYINVGENLFNNEQYFGWDSENLRFSIDLKTRTEYSGAIERAYREASSRGVKLSEALALLAEKNRVIAVGADSIYFEYIFRIPYSEEWSLTSVELKSLINNALLANSGYLLKSSKGIYRIAKADF